MSYRRNTKLLCPNFDFENLRAIPIPNISFIMNLKEEEKKREVLEIDEKGPQQTIAALFQIVR